MDPFCPACGNSMAAGERFCRVCGRDGAAGTVTPAVTTPTVVAVPAETSGKAILSLVCGLLFFVPLAFVAAIVLGHLALSQIRKSAGRLKGEGIAMAGLVLGYIWIAGIPVFLIIAAIAIPNLLRARMAANESPAVASVRTFNSAEVTYSTEHPDVGFTCSLSDLSTLADGSVAEGQKSGYAFELKGCLAGADGANLKYLVVAYPVTRNQSGVRAFCSDESAVIKVSASGVAQDCVENGTYLQATP
jgi:type IV pilus assembly protein PilA